MLYKGRTLLGLAVLLGIVVTACSSSTGNSTVEPGSQPNTGSSGEIGQVNRIAYVSPSGNLFTVDADGGELTQLTGGFQAQQDPSGQGSLGQGSPERGSQGSIQAEPLGLSEYYTWPTWSADGTKLAASRVVVKENTTEISIQVIDARTGRSETVFENQELGLIAEGTPHYIYWAPSGDSLSFLSTSPTGLSLFVWDGIPGNPASAIDRGAPLYYQWSKDASIMALHIGLDVSLAAPPVAGGSRQTFEASGGFRVPAISPDGANLAYVTDSGGEMGLYVAPINDLGQARKVIDVGALTSFLWSPDGTQLAVADQFNPRAALYDRLMLVPVGSGLVTTLTTEDVLAFFWAPTGDKLAWVSVDPDAGEMGWMVSLTDGSDAKKLFSLIPSREVAIMLGFFDQYANSHSPWSPDGKSLVVAGSKSGTARGSNGRTPTGDRIYVLDAEGGDEPVDLGAGVLAVWSWN